MKKLSNILLFLVVLAPPLFAQTYPINAINILLPTPDANTANWATSSFAITATNTPSKAATGTASMQYKLLVTIKKEGAVICGTYSNTSAPKVNFDTPTKSWSGKEAVALLGQGCKLDPGDYKISVQFFGYADGQTTAISDETTKPFSITGDTQTAVQNPKFPEINMEPDPNAGNKGGLSININGLGTILFGGAKKTAPACGTLKAVTRIVCAGRNQQTGLTSYNLTMILTNNPIEQVKSCAFVVNTITTPGKGTLKFPEQALPVAVSSTATVSYTFSYTPASAKATEAQFTISGTWEGNAIPLELKPALKLPVCVECSCGTWDMLTIANAPGVASATVASSSTYQSDSKVPITWQCGKPFSFTNTYQCNSGVADCKAATNWDIQKDGKSIKTGRGANNMSDTFTPTGNGTYTITLNADCGGITCPPAVYTVLVKDCQTEVPPNPPTDPAQNPVTDIPKTTVIDVPQISVKVNIPASNPKKQNKQPNNTGHFYFIIPTQYTGEVVSVTDTLFLQVVNSYATNTKKLNYTIRNLSNNKVSGEGKVDIINNQGVIRIAMPLQNSVVQNGETGVLIMNDYKRYYYISFKRN